MCGQHIYRKTQFKEIFRAEMRDYFPKDKL